MHKLQNIITRRRGGSLLAYGLIVGLISVVALTAMTDIGSAGKALFTDVSDSLFGTSEPSPGSTASPTPEFAATCNALLTDDPGLAGNDGLYTIDPDGVGGTAPYQAWCNMTDGGGGLTLVGSYAISNYAPSKTSAVQETDTNAIYTDALWSSIRDASSHFIMTVDTKPGWVRTSIADGQAVACHNLDTLSPTRPGTEPVHYFAQNEDVGCAVAGSDYCMMALETYGSSILYAINICNNAPADYVESSADALSWSSGNASFSASTATRIWLYAK